MLRSGEPWVKQFDPRECMFFFHSLLPATSPGGPRMLPPAVLTALQRDKFPKLPRTDELLVIQQIREEAGSS